MAELSGKYIFGTVKVGAKGQIVIPKEARDIFNIRAGDRLLLLGDDDRGIAVMKNDMLKDFAHEILLAQRKGEKEC